jgi:hypothetical protein
LEKQALYNKRKSSRPLLYGKLSPKTKLQTDFLHLTIQVKMVTNPMLLNNEKESTDKASRISTGNTVNLLGPPSLFGHFSASNGVVDEVFSLNCFLFNRHLNPMLQPLSSIKENRNSTMPHVVGFSENSSLRNRAALARACANMCRHVLRASVEPHQITPGEREGGAQEKNTHTNVRRFSLQKQQKIEG